jgi:hypothetical protein
MKSGLLSAAGAALAVALTPLAHAQDCGPLNTVVSAGIKDGFESIVGDHIEDAVYETDIAFFDADGCNIDGFVGQYYCLWERPDVAAADKAIAPLYDMAKVCLSGGWDWADLAGQKTAASTTITEGYSMTSTRGPNKGAVVRVFMATEPGQPWREVWLEVE